MDRELRKRRKKREPGPGHYDKDRPAIIAWVSRQGGSVVIQATQDFTVKMVQKAAHLAIQSGSRLYTDSARWGCHEERPKKNDLPKCPRSHFFRGVKGKGRPRGKSAYFGFV